IETFTASYTITQADVDAGEVVNQATVDGTDPFGNPVSDDSGTTNGDDDPLTTPLAPAPGIAVVKSADTSGLSTPPLVGEQITYNFSVTNTGNVTLSGVTLTEDLPGAVVSGGPIPSLTQGETDTSTFTATYEIVQADIDAGQVINQATATGTPPSGPDVSDLSGTTAGDDDPTVSPVGQAPGIALEKTADDSAFLTVSAAPGDILPFTFEVTNTGNTTLTDVTIADPLPGIVITGGPIASLAPGATDDTTITATYAITAADITAGQVDNTATATGGYTDGAGAPQTVSDSDDATGIVVAIDADPEVYPPFTTDGGTTTSMLASDTVANQPATLSNVTISVVSTDPELTLDPETGLITLAPGNPAGAYSVTYEICSVANPAVCDTATETVTQGALPEVEATKTQVLTDNGDGIDGVGDTLTYTIDVENAGNVPLEDVDLTDTLAPEESIEVEAVSGACMLLRRAAFEQVGGMDIAYPMHFEDLDLFARLAAAGWTLRWLPDAEIFHAGGRSSAHRPVRVLWAKHRGLWIYLRRHCTTSLPRWQRPIWLAGLTAHALLQTPIVWLAGRMNRP
ncbi:MAG: DUF11 domain-containing protein, partial [Alphaproteobacteria bacterium]|nr:DUF11 domain-containing protein [Alphaproteobacteria bacterium]